MSETPTPEKIEQLIRDYLKDATLMQVATCVNNQPWVAHVWYSYDKELNLYFISRNDRRHSQEIQTQEKVAGGIVKPPFEGLGQKVRGLTFQGVAKELGNAPLNEAFNYYKSRWRQVISHVTVEAIIHDSTKVRLYKIIPSLYVLFDEINFPEQPRQELPMDFVR